MTAAPVSPASLWDQAGSSGAQADVLAARPSVLALGDIGAHLSVVGHGVDSLSEAVARVSVVERADVEGVDRLIRRLEAVKLSMIAVAERSRIAVRTGSANTAAWVSHATRSGSGVAAGQVALATALDSGLDATRAALAEGAVSSRHAAIIADAMSSLPSALEADERERVELSLVRQARQLEPSRLRQAATMALAAAEKSAAEVAAHQERVLQDQERRAYAAARFTMHHRGDGTSSGSFLVPTGAAQVLQKVLRSMTAPRRDRLGGPEDATSNSTRVVRGADWDSLAWAEKQGRAFTDLLEHLPTDGLTGKVASTIVVTMTAEQVLGAARVAEMTGKAANAVVSDAPVVPGAAVVSDAPVAPDAAIADVGAARCDTGHLHSTGEARRLACNAGIMPLVLGGPSVPIDLGRGQRLFSYHQRTVLATVYDECAAIGCDRPYAWSELHHLTPWSAGGRTDLKDAIPLCGHHHRRMHDGAFQSRVTVNDRGVKSVAFTRRI